jgi:multidrug resistance efflux pump
MDKLPPIPSPPGTILSEFRIRFAPALIFAAVLALTVRIWQQYDEPGLILGEVESARSNITISSPARISELKVHLLDKVTKGQPIAEVAATDPRYLEAQASLTRARLEFIRVNVEPRLRRENNLISYAKLRLDWLHERSELASNRAQLSFWEAEAERLGKLSKQTNGTPFISLSELQRAETQADSLRGVVAELTTLVSETAMALERLDPGDRKLDEEIPTAVRGAMAVEQRALESIEAQLQPQVLLSTMDGVVSAVHRHTGEVVLPGEPIVTISAIKSDRIIAYLRQPITRQLHSGTRMQIRERAFRKTSTNGTVLAVGGQLEPIPLSLLPARQGGANRSVEMGLPIVIDLPSDLGLKPGELVDLKPLLP